jgi:hypothetical protein
MTTSKSPRRTKGQPITSRTKATRSSSSPIPDYQRGLTECPNNAVLWTLASESIGRRRSYICGQ